MEHQVTNAMIVNGRPMGYLTVEEFANICGISKSTIRVWIVRGKLKGVLKINNDWWIDVGNQKPERKQRTKKGV